MFSGRNCTACPFKIVNGGVPYMFLKGLYVTSCPFKQIYKFLPFFVEKKYENLRDDFRNILQKELFYFNYLN